MNPERWQQISRIFKSAISLDEDKRARYLLEQCAKDESLRVEVERLIESHQRADAKEFIDRPAVENGAALLLNSNEAPLRENSLEKGQTFGSYSIIDKLGAGGMGEVYLARDVRLDRTVALKILPADIAADRRRMQRFRQEAKVVSSLNQPNILTIFEFGTVNSLSFLATEYIDGQTLRDYLRGKHLKLAEVLNISIQILAALDAGHEARIVHRDIKPENVMIRRRDQIVKVLDFGLAKIAEQRTTDARTDPTNTEALTAFKTVPGSVMGTVNYMSPEQAQGLPVDERTDLWSTGVIIYEMVAGTMPFKGITSSHTVVQILEKNPPPLAQLDHINTPAELQRIVDKALAKDRSERYQTAKDMLIDLRNLKNRLAVEAEIERSTPSQLLTNQTTAGQDVAAPSSAALSTASAQPLRAARNTLLIWATLGSAVLVVAAIFGISAWRSHSKTVASAPASPASIVEHRLSYWIQVQKYKDKKPYQDPFRLAGEINFEPDYRIRLYVSSPQSGFLYVLNEGPVDKDGTSQFVVLFPSPTANEGTAYVTGGREVQIPSQSWLVFDSEQGKERLWLVFSTNSIPELDAVGRFANPQARGLVNDANLNHAVQAFLSAVSIRKPEVEKTEKETNVKSATAVLIYPITMEHH
ncbi:MAG TPA: serine/threonine-protein kinase [Pyrinomonadaceae bacterium]|nr:serine/threonine-protein kinase [Pyrinomonadaceae bacterium]